MRDLPRKRAGAFRVDRDDMHSESRGKCGHTFAGCPEADNSHRPPGELAGLRYGRAPVAATYQRVMVERVLSDGQYESENMLGDGYGIPSWRRKDRNVSARGLHHVDIVVACAVIGDDLQVRVGVETGAVDDAGTDNQAQGAVCTQKSDQFGLTRVCAGLNDGESCVGKRRLGGRQERPAGDQDLAPRCRYINDSGISCSRRTT